MIPQIKKILYATDLTKNSSYAFYFAADLARKHDAKIVILHCIASIPPAVYYEGGLADGNRTLKKIKEKEKEDDVAEIKKRLQEFCQKVESQIGPPCVGLVSRCHRQGGLPRGRNPEHGGCGGVRRDRPRDPRKRVVETGLSRERGPFSAGEDPKTGFHHSAAV